MEKHRTNLVLPADLAAQIEELAGKRGRNAYIVANIQAAVRRDRLLQFLSNPEPVWKDEDHPELAKLGTVAWLKKQRAQKSDRRKRIEKTWWNRK
jgi:hypothetical protein